MSADTTALVTVALMAAVTFATRAAGYVALRLARPGPRLERFLQSAPRTMFVALVTPALVQGGPAEWLGAVTALATMALTRNLLASMTAATLAVALARTV
jgi:uncharacterized membrane protein